MKLKSITLTNMSDYGKLPRVPTVDINTFQAHTSDETFHHFRELLRLSPIAPAVYENSHVGRRYGIERDWLVNAKDAWSNSFDWRRCEARINSFPNYKAGVIDQDGNTIELQFLALFSTRPDAVPVAFLHGWPSSICEFLDLLDLLREKYAPDQLPYHVIVPSLPGYAYSSLPEDIDYGIEQAASAIHAVMIGLGFGTGYLVQGGDLGSFLARTMTLKYAACRGMHVNMMGVPQSETFDPARMSADESAAHAKAMEMLDTGLAFALEQGTRPSTIGFALSASPLALLSWIGEKMLEWSDEDPSLEKILETVTLYWMTDTISRCFWHNRIIAGGNGGENTDTGYKTARTSVITKLDMLKLPFVEKPCGYSLFAKEIVPIPFSWAEKSCNLVAFRAHERGGHFAAMGQPGELLADFEEYVGKLKLMGYRVVEG